MGKIIKLTKIIIFIVVTMCFLSCVHILIPNGKYISDNSADFIIVDKENIAFFITIDNRSREKTGRNVYKYTIKPDSNGEIFFVTNSFEALYGIGQYNFIWDGKFIKMLDGRGKEVNIYSVK